MEPASVPFIPAFCPRAHCRFHLSAVGWRWVHFGSYQRQCEPRVIQRFRCGHCGSTFSSQTFSTTYYLKRPELQCAVFHRLLACSGYRQIAREARCAPTTVMGQAARLGRHALLALHQLRPRAALNEPLVIDGFEGYACSQYHPLHLNLAIGADSHYVYAFTLAELRRKGRMRPAQRRRRQALEQRDGRPAPGALAASVAELLRLAVAQPGSVVVVRSDEHPAYPRAFRSLAGWTLRHECTPSVAARTPANPLFPVNLMDLLLRHNSANHKRETIAFSKRHQSVVERAALLILWRNFTKPFSENHGGGTPAMRAGVQSGPLSLTVLLEERLFPARIPLPPPWSDYYRRKVPTSRISNPRQHQLKLAF